MKWRDARRVVEGLRRETQLYLPALTQRRGFASSRVEHLLNRLVAVMPPEEIYFEVGVLEGRTLEAAACGNGGKVCIGCDPCEKYGDEPAPFGGNIVFHRRRWSDVMIPFPVGVAFYDGDHSKEATSEFLSVFQKSLASEAIVVIDDWDRISVREGALEVVEYGHMELLAEMPEYTDGLTTAPHHFGYQFGVAVLGWRA